jgi:anti-sigma regulatory factor (Ser/Thr protein kinase)
VTRWALPREARSAGLARELLRAELPVGDARLAYTAELLTDELVANAMLHGAGAVLLEFSVLPRTLRVAVTDESPDTAFGVGRDPGGREPSGRGLFLVDSLATRWGVAPASRGKSVWFELAIEA